jgi:hypothetical protein
MQCKFFLKSLYIIGYVLELIIKKLAIWTFFLQNLANLGHFFSNEKNLFYSSKSYFPGRNLAKIRQ